MLNGHIDTDPLSIDCVDPYTPKVVGNRLEGWGLDNMKGGTAAMIMAAEAVRKSGVQLKGDLVICAVVGETNELGYNHGTTHLLDQGVWADAAIVPEPYGPPSVINTVTGGTTTLIIHTKGSMVGSIIDQDQRFLTGYKGGPVDAFKKMVKILDALDKMEMTYEPWSKMPGAPGIPTYGTVKAGKGRDYESRGSYFVSDFCTAMVGFFFVPGQTPATITEDVIRTIEKLKEEDPEIDYEIETLGSLNPIDAPIDMPVIEAIKKGYRRVTGDEIKEVGAPRAMPSDHTLLYERGMSAVVYGLEGGWIHEPGVRQYHYVEIDQMVLATKVIAAAAVEFCNSEK
jgi:acetylornithine deacetylase